MRSSTRNLFKFIFTWLGWVCLCLSLAACSGSRLSAPASPAANPISPFGLPAPLALRIPAALQESVLLGREYLEKSANAEVSDTALLLTSTAPTFAYGIYALTPPSPEVDSLHCEVTVPAGSEVWIGLGDYAKNTWSFSEPSSGSTTLLLDPARHLSPDNHVLCAIIVCQGDSAQIDSLAIRANTSANQAPLVELEADVVEGSAPLVVSFTAAAIDPDGEIIQYGWDFDNNGTFEESSPTGQIQHTFATPGSHPVTVLVHDNHYAAATADVEITAHGWLQLLIDDEGYTGQGVALALINGRPAISFYETLMHDRLKYAWADTSLGTSAGDWHLVQLCENETDPWAGRNTALHEVNGCPALVYREADSTKLKYARSSTPTGAGSSDWQHVIIDTDTQTGWFPSMEIIDGTPAVGYWDKAHLLLKYAKSSSVDGLGPGDWQITTLQSAWADWEGPAYLKLAVLDGKPVIGTYVVNAWWWSLWYLHSSTTDGLAADDWQLTIVDEDLDGEEGSTGEVGFDVIAGKPLFVYSRFINAEDPDTNLISAYCENPSGNDQSDWDLTIFDTFISDSDITLCEISGLPVASYYYGYEYSHEMRFFLSDIPQGNSAIDWHLDYSGLEPAASLAYFDTVEINGHLAIAYSSSNMLWYAIYY